LALEERKRDIVPFDWAGTKKNLGDVLTRLGERTSGTARLDEAIAAYDEALGVLASGGTEDQVRSATEGRNRAATLAIQRRQTK